MARTKTDTKALEQTETHEARISGTAAAYDDIQKEAVEAYMVLAYAFGPSEYRRKGLMGYGFCRQADYEANASQQRLDKIEAELVMMEENPSADPTRLAYKRRDRNEAEENYYAALAMRDASRLAFEAVTGSKYDPNDFSKQSPTARIATPADRLAMLKRRA